MGDGLGIAELDDAFDFFFLQRVSEPVNGYIQPVGGLGNCADSGRTTADLTRPNDRTAS